MTADLDSTGKVPTGEAMRGEINPYAAPESDREPVGVGRDRFPDLSRRQLKVYLDAHASIRAMAVLWMAGGIILGCAVLVAAARGALMEAPHLVLIAAVAAVLQAAASVGCCRLTGWGHVLGTLVSVVMALALPLGWLSDPDVAWLPVAMTGSIGSIVGALALIAFLRGRALFGPQGLERREIAEELAYRRRNGIG